MSEEDLRIECLRLEIPASGLAKSAIQRQLLGHILTRATSSQTKAPPVYAAVKTDKLGPDREGLNLEDLNLEESDHDEEDLETQDQDLQKTLYSRLAREIPFTIPRVYRMLPLPTRVQE